MPVNTSGIYIPGKLKIEDATANSSDVLKDKIFYNNNGRQVGTASLTSTKTVVISSDGGVPTATAGTMIFKNDHAVYTCLGIEVDYADDVTTEEMDVLYSAANVNYNWSLYMGPNSIPISFTATFLDPDYPSQSRTITCPFMRPLVSRSGITAGFNLSSSDLGELELVLICRGGRSSRNRYFMLAWGFSENYVYLNVTNYSDAHLTSSDVIGIMSNYITYLSFTYTNF